MIYMYVKEATILYIYLYQINKLAKMESSDNKKYTNYLKNLLQCHNISYLTEQEFNKEITPPVVDTNNKFSAGPLQTNLKPQLYGSSITRYSRQMLLKQIGYEGQYKIANYKIAIVGAGGIGCPVAMYLAGAGVGHIGLFDSDCVDMTNLHRQIGHSTITLGTPKTQSLANSLLRLNPTIKVTQHPFITVSTLSNLDSYDLVIDGSDNPQCRYLVNDYLMQKNRKLLSGACVGWEGQVTCYGQNSPCYRCIWGDDQVSMGGCSTIGVVGMLPGIVGMILGVQTIKIIINGSSSLEGQLLTYQARNCSFRKLKLRNKKSECLACGQKKLNIQQYDYSKYSGCSSSSSWPQVPQKSWQEIVPNLKQKKDSILLDVRSKSQYDILKIKESIHIPYQDLSKMDNQALATKFGEDKNRQIFVTCRLGYISKRATDYLIKNGYINVVNALGGITQYGKNFDSTIVDI